MSIRRVTCPSCHAAANVPAAMTNIKCPSCGAVWNVNDPSPSKPATSSQGSDDQSQQDGGDVKAIIFAGVAGTLVFLAIVGIALALFLPSKQERAKPEAAEVATAKPEEQPPPSFRVVDLPETTRQRIYSDYRRMAKSSIEKKVMARKGSVTRQRVDTVLQQIVDREITHFALNYNISEDDVMQIVAEGDAKQWPGSKKPEPKTTP